MNDHFFLPICFAAAAHGALLFGFTKHPRATPPAAKEPTIVAPFRIEPTREESSAPEASEVADSRRMVAPDVLPPPRSPEPKIVTDWTRPRMAVLPFEHVGPVDLRKIGEPLGGIERGTGEGGFGGVVPTHLLDNTPRARFQAAPIYPFEAKRTGTHGEVHVEFVVDEHGRVTDPRVIHSSNRVFDEATLRAVAKWQFDPGRRHGKAVKFRMTVPVMFNLNEP
jgi:periplasmic protein TonB